VLICGGVDVAFCVSLTRQSVDAKIQRSGRLMRERTPTVTNEWMGHIVEQEAADELLDLGAIGGDSTTDGQRMGVLAAMAELQCARRRADKKRRESTIFSSVIPRSRSSSAASVSVEGDATPLSPLLMAPSSPTPVTPIGARCADGDGVGGSGGSGGCEGDVAPTSPSVPSSTIGGVVVSDDDLGKLATLRMRIRDRESRQALFDSLCADQRTRIGRLLQRYEAAGVRLCPPTLHGCCCCCCCCGVPC
jgi:hypothetical protein